MALGGLQVGPQEELVMAKKNEEGKGKRNAESHAALMSAQSVIIKPKERKSQSGDKDKETGDTDKKGVQNKVTCAERRETFESKKLPCKI